MGGRYIYRVLVEALALIGIVCGSNSDFAECGAKNRDNELLLCHCDALCTFYQDCCYGYHQNISKTSASEKYAEFVNTSTCERISGQPYSISLVSKHFVHSHRSPARMQTFIRACRDPIMSDPRETLPVYDNGLKVNFKNFFCNAVYLHTNNIEVDTKNFLIWRLQITANCFTQIEAGLNNRNFTELLSRILSEKYCTPRMVPPEGSRSRLCFQPEVDGCVYRNTCMSYQDPVVNRAGVMFKNKDCAACTVREPLTNMNNQMLKANDKQTVFTLNLIDLRRWMLIRRLCRNTISCNEDEMLDCATCLKPIAYVEGLLHEIEIQIDSNKTLLPESGDSEAPSRILAPFIDEVDVIYVRVTVRTNKGRIASTCRHSIRISLYLNDTVSYSEYRRMLSDVNASLEINRPEIGRRFKVFLEGQEECLLNSDAGIGSGKAKTPGFEEMELRVIVFGSVFGGFVFILVGVIIVKTLINRLKRRGNESARASDNDEES